MYAGRVACCPLVSYDEYAQRALLLFGCVVQWLERWSLTGELTCPMLDLQLTGDHLCG